jgi:hypothetical protein
MDGRVIQLCNVYGIGPEHISKSTSATESVMEEQFNSYIKQFDGVQIFDIKGISVIYSCGARDG